jgi:hypothetical protein
MGIDFLARLKIGSRKSTVVRESQCTFRNDGAWMVQRYRETMEIHNGKTKKRMSTRTCTNEHKPNRTNKEQQTTILGGAQFKIQKYKIQIPNSKQKTRKNSKIKIAITVTNTYHQLKSRSLDLFGTSIQHVFHSTETIGPMLATRLPRCSNCHRRSVM